MAAWNLFNSLLRVRSHELQYFKFLVVANAIENNGKGQKSLLNIAGF